MSCTSFVLQPRPKQSLTGNFHIDNANQVSWQSAYWALVPLAVNAMVQPSGRICSFDPRYRFYLRSSPLVCSADLAGFAVRTATYSWEYRSFQLGLFKAVRVKDIRQEDEPIRVQALEKIPPLRFVIFVLAAAQAVKLFRCSGIPWTITFASFYFIPYAIYEIIGIFGPKFNLVERYEPLAFDNADHLLNRIEQTLGVGAITLQLGFFWWILHLLVFPAENEAGVARSEIIYYFLRILDEVLRLLLALSWISCALEIGNLNWRIWNPEMLLIVSYPAAVILLNVLPMWRRDLQLFLSRLLCSLEMYVFTCFVSCCLSLGMEKVWSNWRKDVLLLEIDEPWSFTAFFCFTFFVLVFMLSLFGYAYLYSQEGSKKPTWVSILG